MKAAFSKALGLDCRRVQFTPDVMPSVSAFLPYGPFKKETGLWAAIVFIMVFLLVSFYQEQLYHAACQAEWYGNLQNAYMEAVSRECLDVPREKLPNLTKLCEEYPLEDFDEITAFITTAEIHI